MELNYHFEDNGKTETIVILHGFLSDKSSMATTAAELDGIRNVITVDLPGFGQSKSTGQDYGIETIADALAAMLESLTITRADVYGYSMGGRVALSFAINHPGYVKRLILESSSPGIASSEDRAMRRQVDRTRADEIIRDYPAFISQWETLPLFSTQAAMTRDEQARQRENRLAQNPEEVADSLLKYGTGAQPSYWTKLSQLHMPILLAVGSEDQKFIDINTRMALHMPDARLEIIEGAGHNIHMEAGPKFGILLLDYLSGGMNDGKRMANDSRI